jgi:hypothetical protein
MRLLRSPIIARSATDCDHFVTYILFDAFQHQRHLQRDRHPNWVGAGCGLIELDRDVLPCRLLACLGNGRSFVR